MTRSTPDSRSPGRLGSGAAQPVRPRQSAHARSVLAGIIGLIGFHAALTAPAIGQHRDTAQAHPAGSGQSAGPAGFAKIYDAPTKANLGGRPVIADIKIFARAADDAVHIALVTDVTKFVDQSERDLATWIATKQNTCGERWSAGDPVIGFPQGAIRFALALQLEMWNCGITGNVQPARLAREGGTVDVVLDPYIDDGRLQARLGRFEITEQEGLSRFLPLAFIARRALDRELTKLNANPKFYRPPQPLHDEGFVYEGISGSITREGRFVITALYVTDGDPDIIERLPRRLAEEGLTQPRRVKP